MGGKRYAKRSPGSWEEKIGALEGAFRALPKGRSRGALGISPDLLVPGIGRALLVQAGQPRRHIPAKKAIEKLERSSDRLIKAIEVVPPEVFKALNFTRPAMFRLQVALRALYFAAHNADMTVNRGRRPSEQANAIAESVALHYWALTARKPTVRKNDGKPYGPFLILLKAVFEILEIEASAPSQAEWVARNWDQIISRYLGSHYPNNSTKKGN